MTNIEPTNLTFNLNKRKRGHDRKKEALELVKTVRNKEELILIHVKEGQVWVYVNIMIKTEIV